MDIAKSSKTKHGQELVPCSFFLTNVNVNGTIVNGHHVHSTSEQVQLHDGDLIALPRIERQLQSDTVKLTPWLQFRFDLAKSALSDGDPLLAQPEVAESAEGRGKRTMKGTADGSVASTTANANVQESPAAAEPACLGTSFVGVEMTPLFV